MVFFVADSSTGDRTDHNMIDTPVLQATSPTL